MATELRRSSRARKQPKSYAEEQAEEQPIISKPKANSKKRIKAEAQEDEDVKDFTLTNADIKGESDFDHETNAGPKKAKRAKKAKAEAEVEGGQLYGHPAHGAIVQWGSKTRKFPKIYEVPEAQRETRTKRDDGGKEKKKNLDWLNDAGETAVRRELAKIKMLKPGQEETRLRE